MGGAAMDAGGGETVGQGDEPIRVPWATGLVIGVAVAVTLVVGVLPSIVLDSTRRRRGSVVDPSGADRDGRAAVAACRSVGLMDLMRLERDGDVFVLHLTHDDNRFNPDSDAEWHEALDEVEASTGPAALVTTGTGKFYSNGLDLDRLMQDGGSPLGEYIPVMLRLFARMLRLPVVTVAAVNGHAFAAGAMMSLTHDFRVMRRDRGFWCLPEADLGMPLTPGMNDLIAARLSPQVAHEAIITARRYPADEAAAKAIVDEAADEEAVLERAVALAAAQAGKDRGAIVALRTRLYADLIATLEEGALP